jgi:hypothetical protein
MLGAETLEGRKVVAPLCCEHYVSLSKTTKSSPINSKLNPFTVLPRDKCVCALSFKKQTLCRNTSLCVANDCEHAKLDVAGETREESKELHSAARNTCVVV